jgi:hypothetical protein
LAAKLIADAKQGDADADQVLRETAAECLERGELPPKPLVDYAATYLRAAASSRKKARQQPNSSKQLHKTKYRDWILALTVHDVARHFNLDRTRNRATTERHCGCSIVARATKLSEKTVQNAWHDYERVASQRKAYVRQAMVSVVTADGAQKHFMVRFPRVGSAETMSRPSNRKAERAKRNRLRRKHRPR